MVQGHGDEVRVRFRYPHRPARPDAHQPTALHGRLGHAGLVTDVGGLLLGAPHVEEARYAVAPVLVLAEERHDHQARHQGGGGGDGDDAHDSGAGRHHDGEGQQEDEQRRAYVRLHHHQRSCDAYDHHGPPDVPVAQMVVEEGGQVGDDADLHELAGLEADAEDHEPALALGAAGRLALEEDQHEHGHQEDEHEGAELNYGLLADARHQEGDDQRDQHAGELLEGRSEE